MSFSNLGDLAQTFALRHRNTELKTDIQRIGKELASGQAADLAKHLGGSYAYLTSIERDMRLLGAYGVNLTEARQMTDMMQIRLEQVSTITGDVAGKLIAASGSTSTATQGTLAAEARLQFRTIVDTLNSQFAGRSLFAGDATNLAPLAEADTILADLDSALSGATTALDIDAAVDSWFASATGFDALAYTGGTAPLSPLKLSETAELSVDVRANAREIKSILAGLAKVIASDADTLPLEDRTALRDRAATDLMTAREDLIGLQAELGLAQEQIDKWSVRNETSRTTLDYAKGALLAVDPYERATELEAAQFQLESLYTITSRLSRLSLVNFLR